MKTVITAITAFLLTLLWPVALKAESAGMKVLNSDIIIQRVNDEEIYYFFQGQTIVIALDEDLRNQPGTWQANIPSLKIVRKFNRHGLALIGIDLFAEPGEHQLCLNLRCLDADRKNELRIKIMQSRFPKTRSARRGRSNKPRGGREGRAISNAFGGANMFVDDLTDGLVYVDPLDRRDVDDSFGLIYRNNKSLAHYGVDLLAPIGTPVKAINGGLVVLVAENFSLEGNMIIINHGLNIFSVYMHLSEFRVKAGTLVQRGDIIGLTGNTGAGANVKGEEHLHCNLMVQGNVVPVKSREHGVRRDYVDPLYFIDTVNKYLEKDRE